MSRLGLFAAAVLAAGLAAPAGAGAQNFPSRPIRIVVPYPAGGPTDTITRVATQGLAAEIGQSVIIENVPGAGGRLGTKDVVRALPDGYTLLVGGSNEYAITPALYRNLDYEPERDLTPVASMAVETNAVVVNPAVPVRSLAELVQYSKEHPDKLASGATVGIVPHLVLEFIRARTGAELVFVPYKGAAPVLADVLGNQIQIAASGKSVLLPLINTGQLRALVVTSGERWPELPEVPTLRESGLEGFPTGVLFGLLAPAKTPSDVIAKLNIAENARLRSPGTQAAIARLGLQMRALSPREFKAALALEMPLWRSVADQAGVHLE